MPGGVTAKIINKTITEILKVPSLFQTKMKETHDIFHFLLPNQRQDEKKKAWGMLPIEKAPLQVSGNRVYQLSEQQSSFLMFGIYSSMYK